MSLAPLLRFTCGGFWEKIRTIFPPPLPIFENLSKVIILSYFLDVDILRLEPKNIKICS